jgi:hypothetical protein
MPSNSFGGEAKLPEEELVSIGQLWFTKSTPVDGKLDDLDISEFDLVRLRCLLSVE